MIHAILYVASLTPFFILHRVSDVLALVLYYGLRYRRKVVRENLTRSFPEKSLKEIIKIEKKFYRNFTDLIIETLKNFSLTEEELTSRCKFTTPELRDELWGKQVNVTGISSHLANWELLALSLAHEFKHQCYGVYKPLSNKSLNDPIVFSRERFGIKMIPIKTVRKVIESHHPKPYLMGLLSDQAPHDYSKAFEVKFLNQKTYVVPGPGLITVQNGLTPIWGWMRRTGRSRFEWGVELLTAKPPEAGWSESDLAQIKRISDVHRLSLKQSEKALALVIEFSKRLEQQIKMAPQDWLWSHRRWKFRS